jgi:hypothetical protein
VSGHVFVGRRGRTHWPTPSSPDCRCGEFVTTNHHPLVELAAADVGPGSAGQEVAELIEQLGLEVR